MRAICDYFETHLRQVLATEIRHCNHNHIAVTPKGWLRHICDSRTNVVRLSHESLANVSRHSRDIRATFARHSHDVRLIELRTFITIVRLKTFSRTSCDCRAKVVRLSHDGFARNDKPRKINILASIEPQTRKVLRCSKELEGWKELDCWMVSRCWVVLDCWMVANIKLARLLS